jgi:FAD:protein FMN transferase
MTRRFRAMGTEIEVLAAGDEPPETVDAALSAIQAIFAREEARFSRFRDDSELAAVNRSAGRWIPVTSPFAEVLRLSLAAALATDGLFDPTVLRAIVAAGYDRDFVAIEPTMELTALRPVDCGRWQEIEIRGDLIRLPPDVGLDLGGLVKGWTADLAAEAAIDTGLGWVLVNAGGDLRLAGEARPTAIGIEEPDDPDSVCCVVRIASGAVATTSTTRRRWGHDRHHVIDPRTGLPVDTPVLQASAWAPTCADAEVAATQALLEGPMALGDVTGLIMMSTGEVVTNLATEEAA